MARRYLEAVNCNAPPGMARRCRVGVICNAPPGMARDTAWR